MTKNFERIIKLVLILCGLMTMAFGVVALSPETFLEKLFDLDYVKNYDIIIRHWSATVFIVGLFLIISTFKVQWRVPVVLLAILGKAYLVVTSILALKYTYGEPFLMVIILDTVMFLLLALVLLSEFRRRKDEKGFE